MRSLLILVCGTLFLSCSTPRDHRLIIRNGVLTVPEAPIGETRPVHGVWEVYVGEALDPDTIQDLPERRYLAVPPREGRYYTPAGERLVTGVITYRAQIRNIPDGPPLALEVPLAFGTLQAWVNGVAVTRLGYPDRTSRKPHRARAPDAPTTILSTVAQTPRTRVESGILIPLLPDRTGAADVVISVESAHYPHGGMTYLPPRLGLLANLQRDRTTRAFRDGLMIGIVILVAGYHLLLVFSPGRDIPNAQLALFAGALAYRMIVAEGEMLLGLIAGLSAETVMRLQGPSMYLLAPLFLLYFRRLFPFESTRSLFTLITRVSWIWVAAALVIPLRWWMDLQFAYYLVILVLIGATATTLVEAIRARRAGVWLIATGALVLLVTGTLDLLYLFGIMASGGFLRIYAMTGFLVLSSLAVSRRMVDFRVSLFNLREQAQRDGLTGLFNRRTFDKQLEEEWSRHIRSAQPLALLMLDADHFKAFNDTYGHQAGDEVLRKIAAILERTVQRTGDVVARYGGEEFVVILPNTGAAGAYRLAGIVCEAVRDRAIPHCTSPWEVVTVSIGVAAVFPEHDARAPSDAQYLIAAADRALYDAKTCGRNTVRSTTTEEDHVGCAGV